MRRWTPFAYATVIAACASGCFTVHADLPGALRTDVAAAEMESVGTLTIERGHWYFLWGLVGSPPADVFSADIKKEARAKGADGVANVTYESQESCGDIGITWLTCSLIAPRTLTLKGDLVRIKKAPLPGRPLTALESTPSGVLVAPAASAGVRF